MPTGHSDFNGHWGQRGSFSTQSLLGVNAHEVRELGAAHLGDHVLDRTPRRLQTVRIHILHHSQPGEHAERRLIEWDGMPAERPLNHPRHRVVVHSLLVEAQLAGGILETLLDDLAEVEAVGGLEDFLQETDDAPGPRARRRERPQDLADLLDRADADLVPVDERLAQARRTRRRPRPVSRPRGRWRRPVLPEAGADRPPRRPRAEASF